MYTKILVPLDGSRLAEQILPYASLLAEAFAIPVELLRVDDSGSLDAWKGNDYLKEIGNWAFPDSVQFQHSVEVANPTEAILRHAAADPKTLIAMATRGLSVVHRWVMGSVAYKVVHAAINPVLLIRPTEGGDPGVAVKLGTVLVPLDGSGLADQILPHVITLAKKLDIEVTLIRAYTSPPDGYLIGDGLYPDAMASQESFYKKEIDEYLTGKVEGMRAAGVTRLSPVASRGDPAEQIIEFARNTQNSLIAMSTHGRSGLDRWLMGSVAEKVVQESRNPVLVIRPEYRPERYADFSGHGLGAGEDVRAG
jgi:nucleotide-binding universal stress UspA family protein